MLSFGYNSFWNFMHGSPAVQELLNKPDLKVEDLLEEDGLLLELKTLNQKLVNFILREENLKELISYVISEPDAEEAITNQKKAYKYPFVCADVLSSDCQAIVSEFFKTKQDLNEMSAIHKAEDAEDQDEVNTDDDMVEKAEPTTETTAASTEESKTEDTTQDETEKKENANSNELPYLDYLFTFLDTKEMNLTSAGYFAKIVNNLFSKKPSALLTYLYEIRPVLLEKMIDHISSKSIAEFVAKILTFESSILVNSEDEIYNTRRNDILKLAIKKLDPKSDIEEINNTAYLLCEVLGKYNTMHCSQEILQNLLEKSTIDYFFEILKSHDSTSCCAVGLILGNIFAYYILINSPKQQNSDEETINEPQKFELTEEIPLVKAFIDNLQDIVQYICNTSGTTFTSQYGAQVTPFGSARLKIVELIIIALKANNEAIYTKLVEYRFIEGLLNLFVKYEWNNLLHNQVEKIVSLFLESNYDDLKTILFERVKLLDFVIDVCRDSEYTLPGPHERKIVKGYNGQITNFANKLVNSKDPIVVKYIEEHENWKDFVDTTLEEINKKNDTRLGGRDPRQAEEDDMGDVQLQLPGMMQKFSKYFNPGMNKNQKDDDDEEDEDQNDDDLNKAQDEDEEDNDDDDEEDNRKGYESLFPDHESKHIIRVDSNNHEVTASRGRTSFGYPNHHDDDDEEEEEQRDDNENYQSMNGPQIINDTLKIEETVLDPDFTSNTIWKKIDWHTADDILKELELN